MKGFTLVEVIVALLVLEVGLLSTTALALHAMRTLDHAVELERAVIATEWLADSLRTLSVPATAGERAAGRIRLTWEVHGGLVRVRARGRGGVLVVADIPSGAP